MNAPQKTIPVPQFLSTRPRDSRGFIVPYFVTWHKDGRHVPELTEGAEPDFRVANTERWINCVRFRWCWLCGKPLGRHLAFLIGPMCAITHTTSEPPEHKQCGEYAALVCPFMTRPRMRRNDSPFPVTIRADAPGYHLDRNPGASALVTAKTYSVFKPHTGGKGRLIRIGEFESVEWYAEGRRATRAEVDASIESGAPSLWELAKRQGDGAERDLQSFFDDLAPWLPSMPAGSGGAANINR